jgi:adenylate kinase family enzyme
MFSRILVVGTSGSGKSSIARALGSRFGIPVTEIDSLFHQPGWTETPREEMRKLLLQIAAQERWIVDGNYTQHTVDTLWPRAEMVVWLDYPRRVVMARVVRRTLWRLLTRAELWNGNRETLRGLFSRDSIVLWAWNTHAGNRTKYGRLEQEFPSLRMVRVNHPRHVDALLREPGGDDVQP